MKTKYNGEISNELLSEYFEYLIGKFYKILPMKESEISTLNVYCDLLLYELAGGQSILMNDALFVELIFNLESLVSTNDKKIYKPLIFKCTNLCKVISAKLKEEGD